MLTIERRTVVRIALGAVLGIGARYADAQPLACQTFEFPGSVPNTTQVYGINDYGHMVGGYTFQYGATEGERREYGFVFRDGAFSTIDFPGSSVTVAYGINNAGQIVGSYDEVGFNQYPHGFLYAGGGYTAINYPSAFFTEAFGINEAGDIVGQWSPVNPDIQPTIYRGYVRTQGGFTAIDWPGSTGQTVPFDINAGGVAAGWAPDSAGYHGFLWDDGQFTPLDLPGALNTLAQGLNDAGRVVGWYTTSGSSFQAGFTLSDGEFTPFDCPGEANTVLYGINNLGAMVGTYLIGSGPDARSFFTAPTLVIVEETTRLKPQRGDQPIEVHFVGPHDLESATLEVEDPDGTSVTLDAPALEQTPAGAPFTYRLVWEGPWTRNNPGTGQPERLPPGNYTVVVKGTRAGGGAEIESAPYDEVSLVEVKTIEIAACGSIAGVTCQDGGAVLTTNPGSGGGKGVFPDAAQPGDDFRRTVLLRAELEPDLGPDAAQATVHFRFVDVDDPSATTAPVDDDGASPTSTDNRSESATIVAAVPASPARQGAAVSHFRVSTRQGNNYRLAASTHEPWLGGLSGVLSSATGEVTHTSGETLAPGVQVSEMLTVWRTLHLELAEIDPSPRTQTDLQHNGIWTNLNRRRLDDVSSPFFTVTLDGLLDHTTADGWEGADVNPLASAGQDFVVIRNNHTRLSTGSGNMCNAVPARFCRSAPPSAADRSYYLRDDELSSLLTTGHDVSLLESLLQGAYIRLEAQPGPALGWRRNLTPADHGQIQGTVPNSAPYWSVLFALGFEPETAEDYDPTDDGSSRPNPPIVGRCDPGAQPPVSIAFLEAIRDYIDTASAACIRPTVAFDEFYRGTTAHEVLHALSLGHDGDTTGAVMCSALKIFASQPHRNGITDEQRARLRELAQPGAFFPVPDLASCTSLSCP